jgi:hypothetical protein
MLCYWLLLHPGLGTGICVPAFQPRMDVFPSSPTGTEYNLRCAVTVFVLFLVVLFITDRQLFFLSNRPAAFGLLSEAIFYLCVAPSLQLGSSSSVDRSASSGRFHVSASRKVHIGTHGRLHKLCNTAAAEHRFFFHYHLFSNICYVCFFISILIIYFI